MGIKAVVEKGNACKIDKGQDYPGVVRTAEFPALHD